MAKPTYRLSPSGHQYLCSPTRNKDGQIHSRFFQDLILIFAFIKGNYMPAMCKNFFESFGALDPADKKQMFTRQYSVWKHNVDAAKQQLLKRGMLTRVGSGRFEVPPKRLDEAIRQISNYLELPIAHKTSQTMSREFELKWRLGARTAALITRLTRQFESYIEIVIGDEEADAKSIMSVMMVSSRDGDDVGLDCRVKVAASGPDASSAIDALTELFTCGARVERCIEPHCPLKPALAGYTVDMVSYGCKNNHTWDARR